MDSPDSAGVLPDNGRGAFAGRFGFTETDRQIEQVRPVGAEPGRTLGQRTDVPGRARRRLNEALGYTYGKQSITGARPLPM